VPDALNGKPVIRFDGVSNNFTLGGNYLFADNTKTGITCFAVVRSTMDKYAPFLLDFGTGASGGGGYCFTYDINSADTLMRKSGGSGYHAGYYTHTKGSNYVVYTGVIKFGAGSTGAISVRLDGIQRASATMTDVTQLTAAEIDEYPTRVSGAGPVSIAMQSKLIDTNRSLQGDIAELIWYDRALSTTEALAVERYLSSKWGVSLDTTADITPPSAITNLAVTDNADTNVTLQWTAPGDDGAIGTATSYDIRYSTSPINPSNWATATPVTGEPTPSAAGTVESMTVTGLSPMTTYYFAIRATDDGGIAGALSNVICQQTLLPQAEIKLWLKADMGITKDANNFVSTWEDQSGQGNNATSSVSTEKPQYVADALNGKPVIHFDGVYNNLTLGGNYLFADNTKTGITCFVVVRSTVDKTDNTSFLLDFGTSSAGGGGYCLKYDLNYADVLMRKSGGAGYHSGYYTHTKGSNYVVYTGVIKFGAGSTGAITVRLNGVQRASATMTDITQLTAAEVDESPTRTWSTGPVSIAMQSKGLDVTRNFGGDIAELIFYTSAFSSTDARPIEEYLATKYGITLD
jgi:hypothetical protein